MATYTALGPEGTRRWTLSGDDAGDFSISSAGALSFRSQPNFEVPADADNDNEYEVTLQASVTSDGETLTDDLEVTVTVTNAEEAGTVTLSPTTRPRVRTEITAALTDPDSVTSANTTGSITTGVTWQWSKATTTSSTWSDISGATTASYTPADADADNFLRATAKYAAGQSAVATTTQTVLALTATPNDGTVSVSPAPAGGGHGGDGASHGPGRLADGPELAVVVGNHEDGGNQLVDEHIGRDLGQLHAGHGGRGPLPARDGQLLRRR